MKLLINTYCKVTAILIAVFFQSLTAHAIDKYEITFKMKGAESAKVQLGIFYGNTILPIDSSKFNKDGEVIFKGNSTLKNGLYALQFKNTLIDFIVKEQQFTIIGNMLNIHSGTQVIGSEENTIYFKYKQVIVSKKAKADSLKNSGAQQKDVEVLNRYIKNYREELFLKYPTSLACKIIKAGVQVFVPEKASISVRNTLFNNIEKNVPELIYTPYLEKTIQKYLTYTPKQPDSLAIACDEILRINSDNPIVHSYVIYVLMKQFENSNRPFMDILYIYVAKKYYLSNTITDSTDWLTVKANIARLEPLLTGKIAPAIDFLDITGNRFPLYALQAKYTILYFWDAECSHCKEITPKLFDLYSKIKKDSIEVYAVSTQQLPYSWMEYIKQHNLNWVNVWEPEKIESVYKTYQIGSTPSIFLLDVDKRILLKKVTFEELQKYVLALVQSKSK